MPSSRDGFSCLVPARCAPAAALQPPERCKRCFCCSGSRRDGHKAHPAAGDRRTWRRTALPPVIARIAQWVAIHQAAISRHPPFSHAFWCAHLARALHAVGLALCSNANGLVEGVNNKRGGRRTLTSGCRWRPPPPAAHTAPGTVPHKRYSCSSKSIRAPFVQ